MRYAGIVKNDFAAAPGISVTVFVQGCPHHCPGCFNMETWDFDGGEEFTENLYQEINDAIVANNIDRNLVIQGGEPLCPENLDFTLSIIEHVLAEHPETKVYVYTGYELNQLMSMKYTDKYETLQRILNYLTWIKVGPFRWELRDITLQYRGSSNQKIIRCPLTLGGKIDKILVDDNEKIKGEGYEQSRRLNSIND